MERNTIINQDMWKIWIIALLFVFGILFGLTRIGKLVAGVYALIFAIGIVSLYFKYLPEIQAGNIDTLITFVESVVWKIIYFLLPPGAGYAIGNRILPPQIGYEGNIR